MVSAPPGALGYCCAVDEDLAPALVPLCTWGTENLAEVTRVFAWRAAQRETANGKGP